MKGDDETILTMLQDEETRDHGFRLLIRKYREKLYHLIRRIVKTHEDTDDVLQNVFIKIFKNIDQFEGKSLLFTWMYRIASNESLTYLEKKNKLGILEKKLEQQSPWMESVGQEMDEEEIQNHIEKAISSLPEKQRLVFHLRYFDALSYHEIAEITQTSEGALKASYHHAVKKIETFLLEK